MTDISRYPLAWPFGWLRSKRVRSSQFGNHSVAQCVREIVRQLNMLEARDVVISSNLLLRQDGIPRSGQVQPTDRGVAVYFNLPVKAKREDRVLACDKWVLVEDNMWAIARHIDALRGQQRWGVGSIEQAFAGYQALPSPAGGWWDVLGVSPTADIDTIKAAYRALAKLTHPDVGGSAVEFTKIQQALDEAMKA